MPSIRQSVSINFVACMMMFVCGCVEETAPSPEPAKAPPSQWREINGSTVVSASDEVQATLDAATKAARATAEAARSRWTAANETERQRWAVKWSAPTIDKKIEHVWVQPVNWSPFRIEGVLTSQPVAELECGKREGELVSFPIEELSDWIRYLQPPSANQQSEFEGGYTVKALESQYGKP